MKKITILFCVALQVFGTILMLANRNPETHWFAVFPLVACFSFSFVKQIDEE